MLHSKPLPCSTCCAGSRSVGGTWRSVWGGWAAACLQPGVLDPAVLPAWLLVWSKPSSPTPASPPPNRQMYLPVPVPSAAAQQAVWDAMKRGSPLAGALQSVHSQGMLSGPPVAGWADKGAEAAAAQAAQEVRRRSACPGCFSMRSRPRLRTRRCGPSVAPLSWKRARWQANERPHRAQIPAAGCCLRESKLCVF